LTTDTIINTFELPGYHLIEEGRITSDGLFYFRTYDEHIPGFVYVVDLNTLNLVYEGEIIIEKAAKRQIDYEQMGWIDVID